MRPAEGEIGHPGSVLAVRKVAFSLVMQVASPLQYTLGITGSNSMGNDFEKRLFDAELAGNAAGQADILRIHIDSCRLHPDAPVTERDLRMLERVVEVLRDLERRLS